jgi:hypothetical protein
MGSLKEDIDVLVKVLVGVGQSQELEELAISEEKEARESLAPQV